MTEADLSLQHFNRDSIADGESSLPPGASLMACCWSQKAWHIDTMRLFVSLFDDHVFEIKLPSPAPDLNSCLMIESQGSFIGIHERSTGRLFTFRQEQMAHMSQKSSAPLLIERRPCQAIVVLSPASIFVVSLPTEAWSTHMPEYNWIDSINDLDSMCDGGVITAKFDVRRQWSFHKGTAAVYAVSPNGQCVLGVGDNRFSQLGTFPSMSSREDSWIELEALSGLGVTQICSTLYEHFALTASGDVYGWDMTNPVPQLLERLCECKKIWSVGTSFFVEDQQGQASYGASYSHPDKYLRIIPLVS